MEAKFNYNYSRTLKQLEADYARLWAPHFRENFWSYFFYLLSFLGTLASFWTGFEGYVGARVIMGMIFFFFLARPSFYHQWGLYKLRQYCRSFPLQSPDMRIGFEASGFWIFDGIKRIHWDWRKLHQFSMVDGLIRVWWAEEPYPLFISTEDVPADFFWELVARLDRQPFPGKPIS